MQWIATSEKDADNAALEKRLWDAANQLWAGAGLKQSEYSEPVLGLIFLRFAEVRFSAQRAKLEGDAPSAPKLSRRGSRLDEPAAYHADGILYLPAVSRFDHLLNLPEGTNIGQTVNDAMRAIERDNPHMAGVLPKGYQTFDSRLLAELIKTVSTIPATLEGDSFGKIYEYFLGTFAMSAGQKGGEFYTPLSIVSLLVEVLSPFHGRISDPACGSSGSLPASRLCGMRFAENDRAIAQGVVQFQGQDKWARRQCPFGLAPRARRMRLRGQQPKQSNATPRRLALMNLALRGIEADFGPEHADTFRRDLHPDLRADYVLANPPFNHSDLVDCMVALPGQLFYSTQIPVCLWFLAKSKAHPRLASTSSSSASEHNRSKRNHPPTNRSREFCLKPNVTLSR